MAKHLGVGRFTVNQVLTAWDDAMATTPPAARNDSGDRAGVAQPGVMRV
ncbi:hypothetical protein ACFYWY_34905 [Streptomyces sp. NPDC002870]